MMNNNMGMNFNNMPTGMQYQPINWNLIATYDANKGASYGQPGFIEIDRVKKWLGIKPESVLDNAMFDLGRFLRGEDSVSIMSYGEVDYNTLVASIVQIEILNYQKFNMMFDRNQIFTYVNNMISQMAKAKSISIPNQNINQMVNNNMNPNPMNPMMNNNMSRNFNPNIMNLSRNQMNNQMGMINNQNQQIMNNNISNMNQINMNMIINNNNMQSNMKMQHNYNELKSKINDMIIILEFTKDFNSEALKDMHSNFMRILENNLMVKTVFESKRDLYDIINNALAQLSQNEQAFVNNKQIVIFNLRNILDNVRQSMETYLRNNVIINQNPININLNHQNWINNKQMSLINSIQGGMVNNKNMIMNNMNQMRNNNIIFNQNQKNKKRDRS